MKNDYTIGIRIKADGSSLETGLKGSREGLEKLSQSATRAGGAVRTANAGFHSAHEGLTRISGATSTAATMFSRLNSAVAGYFSLQAAQHAVQQADAYNMLQARIRLATEATGDYARVSEDLYQVSRQTGAALEDTVAVFQRLATSRGELGATNDQMVTLVRTVQQLGAMSGASTGAMQAGLLQFGQAMGAGVIYAEEFNSILENLPEVASRIVNGMGMTVSELRKAVLDGKALSKDVFQSLLKQSQEIDQQFKELPLSVSRSWGMATNAISKFLGEMDKPSGITAGIAEQFKNLADYLDTRALDDAGFAVDRIRLAIGLWSVALADAKSALVETSQSLQDWLATGDAYGRWINAVKQGWIDLPINVRTATAIIIGEADQMWTRIAATADILWIQLAQGWEATTQAAKSAWDQVKLIVAQGVTSISAVLSDWVRGIAGLTANIPLPDVGLTAGLEQAAKGLDRLAEGEKAMRQEIAETAAVHAGRNEALDAEMAAVRKNADAKIAASRGAIEMALEERDAIKQRVEEEIRAASMRAALDQVSPRKRPISLAPTKNPADPSHQAINTPQNLIDKKGISEAQSTLEKLLTPMENYGRQMEHINALRTSGALAIAAENVGLTTQEAYLRLTTQAQKALSDSREQDLEKSKNWRDGVINALTSYANEVMDSARNWETATTNAFRGMEDALVSFISTGKADWKSLVDSILADLARIAVRESITGPLAKALGMSMGGSSSGGAGSGFGLDDVIDGVGSFVSSIFHDGGVVGDGAISRRSVPSQIFIGAPRFHSGGIIGPDEVPIIAQRGERVLSRKENKAYEAGQNGAGDSGRVEVQIINVTNPDMIKQLVVDTIVQKKDTVVNMVLNAMDERNLVVRRF